MVRTFLKGNPRQVPTGQRAGDGMRSGSGLRRGKGLPLAAAALAAALLGASPARAVDEIQVYTGEINEVGQFSVQQHLNYTIKGLTEPAYPGALVDNHALNGTPEFAYGVTPWLELGLYIPWAVNGEGQFLSNNFKLRTEFATPDAAKKDFFYGINFEYDFPSWPFVPAHFAMEVRPIIGWRDTKWEFIINPIIDFSWGGQLGGADFAPAARLARNLGEDRFIGLEYYSALGTPGNWQSFQQQSHQLFAVTDFKIGEVDVDFGIGYGLTPGSDRWVAKTIISYAFPVQGKKSGDSSSGMKAPINLRSMFPEQSPEQMARNPLAFMQ
jgi:hypothetical protein